MTLAEFIRGKLGAQRYAQVDYPEEGAIGQSGLPEPEPYGADAVGSLGGYHGHDASAPRARKAATTGANVGHFFDFTSEPARANKQSPQRPDVYRW